MTQSLDARHNLSIPDVPEGGSSRCAPRPGTACRQQLRRQVRAVSDHRNLELHEAPYAKQRPELSSHAGSPPPPRRPVPPSNLVRLVFRACVRRLQCARRWARPSRCTTPSKAPPLLRESHPSICRTLCRNDLATAPGARSPKSGPTGHHWGNSRPRRQVRNWSLSGPDEQRAAVLTGGSRTG